MVRLFAWLVMVLVIAAIGYGLFGHRLVIAMYEARTLPILDDLIEHRGRVAP